MRILLTFVSTLAAILTISALSGGAWRDALVTGAVTLVAGVFLLRNLRDPEVTRQNGLQAQVSFSSPLAQDGPGGGTQARVWTHNAAWVATLDRTPERGDMEIHDVPHRGWVWLASDGLPERVRITYGTTWKTWPVVYAAKAPKEGPNR